MEPRYTYYGHCEHLKPGHIEGSTRDNPAYDDRMCIDCQKEAWGGKYAKVTDDQFAYLTRHMSPGMSLAVSEMISLENKISLQSVARFWGVSVSGLRKALKRFESK